MEEISREAFEYLIRTRRYLHENPEPAPYEDETCRFIGNELARFGIPYEVVENGGIIARILGSQPGRTLLLRADLDALPMEEGENNLSGKKAVCSVRPGAAHLCGHDAHTAMLLTAAGILNEKRKELEGEILLVWERGEENYSGIDSICKALKRYHVDHFFGIHVYAALESGCFAVPCGPCMAGNAVFHVTIRGKGCHGATQELGIDPIQGMISVINALNARIFRLPGPFEQAVFSIGSVHGGTCWNIIPEEAGFDGSFRFFDEELGRRLIAWFKRITAETAHACGCEAVIDITERPPVINQAEFAGYITGILKENLGRAPVREIRAWMASESAAYYLKEYPGAFAFLGIANLETGCGAPHHNPGFDVDESALAAGVKGLVSIAITYCGRENR